MYCRAQFIAPLQLFPSYTNINRCQHRSSHGSCIKGKFQYKENSDMIANYRLHRMVVPNSEASFLSLRHLQLASVRTYS